MEVDYTPLKNQLSLMAPDHECNGY